MNHPSAKRPSSTIDADLNLPRHFEFIFGGVVDRPLVAGDPRGEGLVVATFDADGRPRVRVFWTKDPSAVVAPEVR